MNARRMLAIGCLVALAACSHEPRAPVWRPKATKIAMPTKMPASSETVPVVYRCADGTRFKAVFDDDLGSVRIEPQSGAPATLYIAASSGGYAYRDGGKSLVGNGDEASWTDGSTLPVKCTAEPAQ